MSAGQKPSSGQTTRPTELDPWALSFASGSGQLNSLVDDFRPNEIDKLADFQGGVGMHLGDRDVAINTNAVDRRALRAFRDIKSKTRLHLLGRGKLRLTNQNGTIFFALAVEDGHRIALKVLELQVLQL